MLSVVGRKPSAVVVEPAAKALLKLKLTPNAVTVLGTVVAVAICLVFIPRGQFIWAAVLLALSTCFDLVDGTMARMSGGGTKFGATLDATCDRLTDGALFGAIVWWMVYVDHSKPVYVALTLIVLVCSQVISYVKARGEASGLVISGGLVERFERLTVTVVALVLVGCGLSWALPVAMILLASGSIFTVLQRLWMAKTSSQAKGHIADPKGAKHYDV